MIMSYMLEENNPFYTVELFEKTIANFYGAKYGVAVDSCTHAIELCLRHEGYTNVAIPERTYISIPFTCKKLGIEWKFEDNKWEEYYYIKNTNIIDGAVMWGENTYTPGTYLCLSFQFRKHLSIGRGGMILTDSKVDYEILKKMSYDGRSMHTNWGDQDIDIMGYHYYLTPEASKVGLDRFYEVRDITPKKRSYMDYPYLPKMSVFK